MNFNVLSEERLNEIVNKIDKITDSLNKIEKMNFEQSEWLDTKAASEFLKVTTRSIFNYKERGLIPFSISGGKLLFRRKDLENYLMKNRIEANQNRFQSTRIGGKS